MFFHWDLIQFVSQWVGKTRLGRVSGSFDLWAWFIADMECKNFQDGSHFPISKKYDSYFVKIMIHISWKEKYIFLESVFCYKLMLFVAPSQQSSTSPLLPASLLTLLFLQMKRLRKNFGWKKITSIFISARKCIFSLQSQSGVKKDTNFEKHKWTERTEIHSAKKT